MTFYNPGLESTEEQQIRKSENKLLKVKIPQM